MVCFFGLLPSIYHAPQLDIESLTLNQIVSFFLIACILTFCLTTWFYPWLLKTVFNRIKKYQTENNIVIKNQSSVLNEVFKNTDYLFVYVYIFDLENNYIESGYLKRYNNSDEEMQLSLAVGTGQTKEKIVIEDVLEIFNSKTYSNDAKELVLLIDKKMKVFVFYQELNVSSPS